MIIFKTPLVLLALAVLIALHIVSHFVSEKLSKILTFVNIGLHVALLFLLMYKGFTIEEAVLAYMISLFAYTLTAYLTYKLRDGKTKEEAEAEAASKAESTPTEAEAVEAPKAEPTPTEVLAEAEAEAQDTELKGGEEV